MAKTCAQFDVRAPVATRRSASCAIVYFLLGGDCDVCVRVFLLAQRSNHGQYRSKTFTFRYANKRKRPVACSSWVRKWEIVVIVAIANCFGRPDGLRDCCRDGLLAGFLRIGCPVEGLPFEADRM